MGDKESWTKIGKEGWSELEERVRGGSGREGAEREGGDQKH